LSIVHAEDAANKAPSLAASAADEWLHVAAAVVISAFLRTTSGERIKRVSRFDNGLNFYLDAASDDEERLLSVVGSPGHDAREALTRAAEQAAATPCAHKIAAAVAFGSGKAALRVLS
jgi:hypothetical protein